jgi:hypothetical protein
VEEVSEIIIPTPLAGDLVRGELGSTRIRSLGTYQGESVVRLIGPAGRQTDELVRVADLEPLGLDEHDERIWGVRA